VLHLHPAKIATFLEKLTRIERRKRKIYFSKNFKKSLPDKKEVVLLHPLNERIAKQKKEHVPRHIELTAVLREILKQ